MLQALDHVTIRAQDVARTVHFYQTALGMCVGPRPPFGVAGAWLYLHHKPVLHIVQAEPCSAAAAIDHFAFVAQGRRGAIAALDALGVAVEPRSLPDGSAMQLFFRDPDGARIELVFRDPEDQ